MQQWKECGGLLPRSLRPFKGQVDAYRKSGVVRFLERSSRRSVVYEARNKPAYCNVVFPGGGSWYLSDELLSIYWSESVSHLLGGNFLFASETRSRALPDRRLAFFLDFDGSVTVSRDELPGLLVAVAGVAARVLSESPLVAVMEPSLYAMCVCVTPVFTKFGCHVIVNNVLVTQEQQRFMTALASEYWSGSGYPGIQLDVGASIGLRPVFCSKTTTYPLLDQAAVHLNQGRSYDLVAVYHYDGNGRFVQCTDVVALNLFLRPISDFWTQPAVVRVRDLKAVGSVTLSAQVAVSVVDIGKPLTSYGRLGYLADLWCDMGCVSDEMDVVGKRVCSVASVARDLVVLGTRDVLVDGPEYIEGMIAASMRVALGLTSVLPGAHPGAVSLDGWVPEIGVRSARLTRGSVANEVVAAVVGLGLGVELMAALFGVSMIADSGMRLETAVNGDGDSVFVVMVLATYMCPVSEMHKSAKREIWMGVSDVTLRCFSHRCADKSCDGRYGVVKSVTWQQLAEYFGYVENDDENSDWNVALLLRETVSNYGGFAK